MKNIKSWLSAKVVITFVLGLVIGLGAYSHISQEDPRVALLFESNLLEHDLLEEEDYVLEDTLFGDEYVFDSSSLQAASVRGASCTDSDGGRNAYEFGTVTYKKGNRSRKYRDRNRGKKVIEFYCRGNRPAAAVMSCPDGLARMGVCKKPETSTVASPQTPTKKPPVKQSPQTQQSCVDTDEGIDPYTWGKVTWQYRRGRKRVRSDRSHRNGIVEYYCKKGRIRSKVVQCEHNRRGACVKEGASKKVISVIRTDGIAENSTIVAGVDDVTVLQWDVTPNTDVRLESLTAELQGSTNPTNYTFALFVGDARSGNQIGSAYNPPASGKINFTNLKQTLKAGQTHRLSLIADTIEASAGDAVRTKVTDIQFRAGDKKVPTHYKGHLLSSNNSLQGSQIKVLAGGSLTAALGKIFMSDILVDGQRDREVLQVRLMATGDEIHIKDLYFENDINNDDEVDNFEVGDRLDFKLYDQNNQLIQEKQMRDGKLHFELGNSERIRVPKGGSVLVTVKVDVRSISKANQTGKRLRLSLDDNHATKGLEVVTASTGNDLAAPSDGWGQKTPGARGVLGEEFVVHKSQLEVRHASQQPVLTGPLSAAYQEFYRFTVSAGEIRAAEIGKLSLNMSVAGMMLRENSIVTVKRLNADGTVDTNAGIINTISKVSDNKRQVAMEVLFQNGEMSAGETVTYSVFVSGTDDDANAVSDDDAIAVAFGRDGEYHAPGNRVALASEEVFWSDRSSTEHSFTTQDWMNGYLIQMPTTAHVNEDDDAVTPPPTTGGQTFELGALESLPKKEYPRGADHIEVLRAYITVPEGANGDMDSVTLKFEGDIVTEETRKDILASYCIQGTCSSKVSLNAANEFVLDTRWGGMLQEGKQMFQVALSTQITALSGNFKVGVKEIKGHNDKGPILLSEGVLWGEEMELTKEIVWLPAGAHIPNTEKPEFESYGKLKEGWHLFRYPSTEKALSVEKVFQSIEPHLQYVNLGFSRGKYIRFEEVSEDPTGDMVPGDYYIRVAKDVTWRPYSQTTPPTLEGLIIPLTQGWNMVSFNRIADSTKVSDMLKGGGFTEGDVIENKDKSLKATYQNGAWTGSLKTIDVLQGYSMKVGKNMVLNVQGTVVNENMQLSLTTGENLIGYLPQTELSVAAAFGSALTKIDRIVGEGKNYNTALPEALQTLKTLKPGKGYTVIAKEDFGFIYGQGAIEATKIHASRRDGLGESQTIVAGVDNVTGMKISLIVGENKEVVVGSPRLKLNTTGNAKPEDLTIGLFVDGTLNGTPKAFSADGTVTLTDASVNIAATEQSKELVFIVDTVEKMAGGSFQLVLTDLAGKTKEGNAVEFAYLNENMTTSGSEIKGAVMNLLPSGSLSATLHSAVFSDVLVAGQTDVDVLQVRLSAKDDEVQIKDLYFENDLDGNEVVDNGEVGGRLDFKLYDENGQLIQEKLMIDGKLHFELGNNERIRVPKDDSTFVTIKVDVRSVTKANQSGKRLKLSLDGDHATRGFEAVTATTGNDITASDPDLGWESLVGIVSGHEFLVYKSKIEVRHASTQPVFPGPGLATQELYRFSVTADQSGDVELGKMTFDVGLLGMKTGDGLTSFDLKTVRSDGTLDPTLKPANAIQHNIPVGGSNGKVAIDFGVDSMIARGETKTYAFLLNNTVQDGPGDDMAVTFVIRRDTSHVASGNKSTVGGQEMSWSDHSSTSHSGWTEDWHNGFLIQVDTMMQRNKD